MPIHINNKGIWITELDTLGQVESLTRNGETVTATLRGGESVSFSANIWFGDYSDSRAQKHSCESRLTLKQVMIRGKVYQAGFFMRAPRSA